MKRLAILLAAVGLGSGCVIDNCETPTLSIDWAFVDAAGYTNLSCAAVGAEWVDVYVDGQLLDSVDCALYSATWSDPPSGTREIVVEGVDGLGRIVARDWVNAKAIDSCGSTWFGANPGQAELKVDYLADLGACCANPTYLWYSLTDVIADLPAVDAATGVSLGIGATDSCSAKTSVDCGQPLLFTVPYGRYTLDWISEVDVGAPSACTGFSVSDSVSAVTGDVLAPTPTTPVTLSPTFDIVGTCP
jgi:hypothetical protein